MGMELYTTRIEVKYVNPPREGQKTGSVKATDGKYYNVWPEKLDQFTEGQSYEVEVEPREFKGETYRTIKRVLANGAGHTAPAPAAQSNGAGGASNEFAWTQEIVARAMGSGQFAAADIPTLVQEAKIGFALAQGQKPSTKNTNDDEIPF